MKQMKLTDIKIASPFKDLFEIGDDTLKGIQDNMLTGFDRGHPIVIWKEKGLIVDGHTRFKAAIANGFTSVPVVERSFETEEQALTYAIHNQVDRRNLTEGELLRLVEKVDEHSDNWGGSRNRGEASFANEKVDSRERTAKILGISKQKVSECRKILQHRHINSEIISAIETGKITIHQAYVNPQRANIEKDKQETRKRKEREILLKIDEVALSKAASKQGIKSTKARDYHLKKLTYVCAKLLPQLSNKEKIMEKIKAEFEFFKKRGKLFDGVTRQPNIREFLEGPFINDLISVLEMFDFSVQRPTALEPAEENE